jgi:hypothetical protein
MGSAVASAAIARRYSRNRKINQSESDSEEYFHRGKECQSRKMVSIYHFVVFFYTVAFAHISMIVRSVTKMC